MEPGGSAGMDNVWTTGRDARDAPLDSAREGGHGHLPQIRPMKTRTAKAKESCQRNQSSGWSKALEDRIHMNAAKIITFSLKHAMIKNLSPFVAFIPQRGMPPFSKLHLGLSKQNDKTGFISIWRRMDASKKEEGPRGR